MATVEEIVADVKLLGEEPLSLTVYKPQDGMALLILTIIDVLPLRFTYKYYMTTADIIE